MNVCKDLFGNLNDIIVLLFGDNTKIGLLFFRPFFLARKASFSQTISDSMANTSCQSAELEICRDDSAARVLKFVAMASILLSGVAGVAIPLVGKHRRFLRTDGSLFVAAKAFAAGVILATGFVHMLSSASEALSNPCLPQYPWAKFPFCGFFAMMASLLTLLVDFLGTQYYERKQGLARPNSEEQSRVGSEDPAIEAGIVTVPAREWNGKVFGEEEGGGMHIVGMHAHAAHHRHNHGPEHGACDGHVREHSHGHGHEYGPGHSHGFGDGDEEGGVRHVVVSQVNETLVYTSSLVLIIS